MGLGGAPGPCGARTRRHNADFLGIRVRGDDAGNVIGAWNFRDTLFLSDRDFVSTVSTRRRDAASGVWSNAHLLQKDPAAVASDVELAVEPDGTAWAVWTERTFKDTFFAAFDRYAVFARKFTPAVGWSAAEAVSQEFPAQPIARVSTDKRGNPRVLIYLLSSLPLESTLHFTSRNGGTWAPLTELVRAPPSGGIANHLGHYDLAVDADDNAIVIWRQHDGMRNVILARRFAVGTGWGPITLLMVPSPDDGHSPQLAMDPQGNAFAVWHEFDGQSFGIWAARFTKANGWGRLDIISSPDLLFGSTEPRIAFDGANAVAVWRRYDSAVNGTVVRANYDDAQTGWGMDEPISGRSGVANGLELSVSASGFATATWWHVEYNIVTPRSATRIP